MLTQFAEMLSGKNWRPWSLAKGLIWLTIVMVFATAIVAAVTAQRLGNAAWVPGVVAGSVCWLAGGVALVLASLGRNPMAGANLALLGMLVRMGLPLLSSVFVQTNFPEWQEFGYAGQLVLLFLVMLFTEIVISLKVIAGAKAGLESLDSKS